MLSKITKINSCTLVGQIFKVDTHKYTSFSFKNNYMIVNHSFILKRKEGSACADVTVSTVSI